MIQQQVQMVFIHHITPSQCNHYVEFFSYLLHIVNFLPDEVKFIKQKNKVHRTTKGGAHNATCQAQSIDRKFTTCQLATMNFGFHSWGRFGTPQPQQICVL